MTSRPIILFAAAFIFTFIFPVLSATPQIAVEGGVQIVPLSASGRDIATSVVFSRNGQQLIVGTSAGISIFDSESYSRQQFIETGAWVRSVALSPDGQILAAGLFDNTARLWHFPDGEQIRILNEHKDWVRMVAFSPDARLLATVGDDNAVRLWDVTSGSVLLTVEHLTGARALAFSPLGQTLAIGLQDSTIQLLNVSDGSLIKTFAGHTDWVRSLMFSPDGAALASGAFDATIILWDVSTGQLKHKLTDHQSSVLGLAFSPDGMTLASGSVDSTVKLWNSENGSLLRTLAGHEDFVYGVAFSPDGKVLASGSSDNTVRLWDVTQAIPEATPLTNTPSDCRACHHPRGRIAPPRVSQVKCDACHADGIGINFCPAFSAAQTDSLPIRFGNRDLPVGLPIADDNLAVVINYPTNGESLYVASAYQVPLYVEGFIKTDAFPPDVILELSVFSRDDSNPAFTVTGHPSEGGSFEFMLTQNPDRPLPPITRPESPDCLRCHGSFHSQSVGDLPDGEVRLLVRATTSDGRIASDERWFYVDTSREVEVDVRVIDKSSGQPIAGLPVQASTILYQWRERYAREETNSQGVAHISFEALTQGPTVYQFTVPDTVVGGYYYTTLEPTVLTLLPGETPSQAVTVEVEVQTSHVVGRLTGAFPSRPLDVLAIHLPDGTLNRVQSENDHFEFRGLPDGEYLLALDPSVLSSLGLQSQPVTLDLSKAPGASLELALTPQTGTRISGNLLDENTASSLPFAWIVTASGETFVPDPVTGEFSFFHEKFARQALTVLAPGYYSQTQAVDLSNGPVNGVSLAFVRQPETRSLNWGDGKIILPSDSVYELTQNGIELTRGWLWGHNGSGIQTIKVAGTQIGLTSGTFALEYLPLEGGWLYLSKGQAVIGTGAQPQVQVKSGEMVFLLDGAAAQPIPYEPSVLAVLKSENQPLISAIWEPGLDMQVKNRLAQFGIGLVQIITFITYLTGLVFLVLVLSSGIYWFMKEYKHSPKSRRPNAK